MYINDQLFQRVIDYLVAQPYKEVAQVLGELHYETQNQPAKESKDNVSDGRDASEDHERRDTTGSISDGDA